MEQEIVSKWHHFASFSISIIKTGAVTEWIKAVAFEAMKLVNREVRGSILVGSK